MTITSIEHEESLAVQQISMNYDRFLWFFRANASQQRRAVLLITLFFAFLLAVLMITSRQSMPEALWFFVGFGWVPIFLIVNSYTSPKKNAQLRSEAFPNLNSKLTFYEQSILVESESEISKGIQIYDINDIQTIYMGTEYVGCIFKKSSALLVFDRIDESNLDFNQYFHELTTRTPKVQIIHVK